MADDCSKLLPLLSTAVVEPKKVQNFACLTSLPELEPTKTLLPPEEDCNKSPAIYPIPVLKLLLVRMSVFKPIAVFPEVLLCAIA